MFFIGATLVAGLTSEECSTCIKDVPSIDILKMQICTNAQQKMKLMLSSRSGLEAFTSVDDMQCFPSFTLPSNASDDVERWGNANNDGMQMFLSYVVWKQECAVLREQGCKSAASHSPCQWKAVGGPEGTGQCSISDRVCVDETTEDACLDQQRCRWVPHNDIADVAYVPCRFVRNFRELCAVYNSDARCGTNKNCKWDAAANTCMFNACVPNEHASLVCACGKAGADPRNPAPVCHYGEKCTVADMENGPYIISDGQCEPTTPPPPQPNTCAMYWETHCNGSADDESATWKPLWEVALTGLPASEPYKVCCRKTCETWMEDGNTCPTTHTPISAIMCGIDQPCSESICCQPTCASYQCNANMPAVLIADTAIMKENAKSIPCGGNKPACSFNLCCDITCASKGRSACDETATPRQYLKGNAPILKCNANPNPVAAHADGCDSTYCCEIHRPNCQDVIDNGEAGCGQGSLSGWVHISDASSKECGTDVYRCGQPKYCCQRRCQDFLTSASCPEKQDPTTNKDVVCNDDCHTDQCCVETCANFKCSVANDQLTGLLPVENAQSIICAGSTSCDFTTCCKPTCEAHKLGAPQLLEPQTCSGPGVMWRDSLATLLCGSPGSSTNCNSLAYCCKKTCAHYVATTGCPGGYKVKPATSGEICGEAGKPACGNDFCCLPTCDHFIDASFGGPGCNSGNFLNQGWRSKSPSDAVCTTNEQENKFNCFFNECCERTCGDYLGSTVEDVKNLCARKNQSNKSSSLSLKCNAGCSADVCCEDTCLSTHTCTGLGIGYQNGKATTACSNFDGGACNIAYCCEITCGAFTQDECDGGFIKDSTEDSMKCVPDGGSSTGTIADCSNAQCCKPTCAAEPSVCIDGYVKKDVDASTIICDSGGCDVNTCCGTTCQTYFSETGAGCPEFYIQVGNSSGIECKHNEDCQQKCCMPTCASWLKIQGLGNDATCGISSVTATNGKTYTGGVKRAGHSSFLCADNAAGECTSAYCCEFTCAKWYHNSCYNSGTLTIKDASGNEACSANPSPTSPVGGLEHLFPCSDGFCCEDPCSVIPKCAENEVQKSSGTCRVLTTCNVHMCCVCGKTGKSCISDTNIVPTQSCQPGSGYAGEMKCRDLKMCSTPSAQAVPAACKCGAADGAPSVCRSFVQEHCYPDREERCVPSCKAGGNSPSCQCGDQVCSAESYCDKSVASPNCIPCGNSGAACNTAYCHKYNTATGEMCVPKSEASALEVGKSAGGVSGGMIAAIAGACVLLVGSAVLGFTIVKQKGRAGGGSYVDE